MELNGSAETYKKTSKEIGNETHVDLIILSDTTLFPPTKSLPSH